MFAALVYNIWMNRNMVFWERKCSNFKYVIGKMIDDVKCRIVRMLFRNVVSQDKDWFFVLG